MTNLKKYGIIVLKMSYPSNNQKGDLPFGNLGLNYREDLSEKFDK